MRVYLPATLPGVARLLAAGQVAGPSAAHAVTPALRADHPHAELEELEYDALLAAAAEALALLDDDSSAARRRVVLAADVPDASLAPRPDAGSTAVVVSLDVPLDRIVSAHVDEAGADPDDDPDLLWYATQELSDLLARG